MKKSSYLKEYALVSEAAEILGVSTQTLRRWDDAGKLKSMRHSVNNYRYYKRKDIKDLKKKISEGFNIHDNK